MRTMRLFCIVLFNVSLLTSSAPSFQLGTDYTLRIGFDARDAFSAPMIATDGEGALYVLGSGDSTSLPANTVLGSPERTASYVMKLSPAGDSIVYLTVLGFRASAIAV